MKKFLVFFLGIVRSYGISLIEAIHENEYTQEFKERYPRLFRFARNRLSPSEYLGLHLTVGFFLVVYLTMQFVELTQALSRNTELVQIDTNIITFLSTVRTGALMRPMLFFTALGNWPTILFVFLFFTAIWLREKRWFRLWMFFLTIAGSEFLSVLMKIFIERPRPDPAGALLLETTYSFPSGHALIALSCYGFVGYILQHKKRSLWYRLSILFFVLFLVIAIGVSRVYLGVHWPSDVLGGYLLALLWLTIIATAAEIRRRFVRERQYAEATLFPFRWLVTLLLFLGAAMLIYIVSFVERPHWEQPSLQRHIALRGEEVRVSLSDDVLEALPSVSEGLTGRPLEPISLFFIGSEETLANALERAGWFEAEKVTLRSTLNIASRALRNQPYPQAPVSPAFMFGRPQDSAWQKPTDRNSPRERHHIRLWQSPYVVGQETLWVGTASLDAGVKLTPRVRLPMHRIAPAIDIERDFLVNDLRRIGAIAKEEVIQRYDPFLGTNALGDPFFTDGKVVILTLLNE